MAEPRTVNEGVEEEVTKAKSAEDRKAAAALASLDSSGDGAEAAEVDAAAVSKAMKNLGTAASAEKKEVKKVKVDAADVALLVSPSTPSSSACLDELGPIRYGLSWEAERERSQGRNECSSQWNWEHSYPLVGEKSVADIYLCARVDRSTSSS